MMRIIFCNVCATIGGFRRGIEGAGKLYQSVVIARNSLTGFRRDQEFLACVDHGARGYIVDAT